MRGKNRNSIADCLKLPQFTTMNVIDGQADLVIYSSLIFYSLTINNILNIIILLILAGIAIAMLTGKNGLLGRAQVARDENEKNAATEAINFKITNVQIAKYTEEQRMPTLKELADNFCEDEDFDKVEEKTELGSLTKISNENPTAIIAKLKAYPYEFEINSSLQLASINGVKVASNPTSNDTVSREEYNALLTRISALETSANANSNSNSNPTGTIIAYSVNNVPSGYLKCEGQAVSRTEYSELFAILGTTYGSGNGSTTFNVPDLRGEFLRGTGTNGHSNGSDGENVGTHQEEKLPNITGTLNFHGAWAGGTVLSSVTGAFKVDKAESGYRSGGSTNSGASSTGVTAFDASESNSIYSGSHVTPTNTSVLYCIKY